MTQRATLRLKKDIVGASRVPARNAGDLVEAIWVDHQPLAKGWLVQGIGFTCVLTSNDQFEIWKWEPEKPMKDLERVAAALQEECFRVFRAKWSQHQAEGFARVAIEAREKQDQETAAVVDQAAKCNRMLPFEVVRPRTCPKCGLGPCHVGLGHVQQPIAGMVPNKVNPWAMPEGHFNKPALDEYTKAALHKLQKEAAMKEATMKLKPGPGVFAPGAEQPPEPVRWEVMCWDNAGGDRLPVGYEPFAATDTVIWLRRRVP